MLAARDHSTLLTSWLMSVWEPWLWTSKFPIALTDADMLKYSLALSLFLPSTCSGFGFVSLFLSIFPFFFSLSPSLSLFFFLHLLHVKGNWMPHPSQGLLIVLMWLSLVVVVSSVICRVAQILHRKVVPVVIPVSSWVYAQEKTAPSVHGLRRLTIWLGHHARNCCRLLVILFLLLLLLMLCFTWLLCLKLKWTDKRRNQHGPDDWNQAILNLNNACPLAAQAAELTVKTNCWPWSAEQFVEESLLWFWTDLVVDLWWLETLVPFEASRPTADLW